MGGLAIALLSACTLIGAHPFPDYLGGIEARIDISARISEVLQTAVAARYEIASVSTPSGERVLLLIDPAVAEPTADSPTPRLLIFDRLLSYLGTVVPESPLGYVGRPFLYAADGSLLSGDTVFDRESGSVVLTLSPTGLTGFGFSTTGTAPTTYVLSLPAGESASNRLVLNSYNDIWSVPTDYSVEIADPTAAPETGYTLSGARLEADGETVTIVVRDTATDSLLFATSSLSAIVGGTAAPLVVDGLPEIDGTDATVYLTRTDVIVRRSKGIFEHYTPDGRSLTSSRTSDRRTGIVYGFSSDGGYLYRLDPATGMFARIRTWW